MDTSFLAPESARWAPPSIVLMLYANVEDTQPQKVDLMEFVAQEPDPSLHRKGAKNVRVFTHIRICVNTSISTSYTTPNLILGQTLLLLQGCVRFLRVHRSRWKEEEGTVQPVHGHQQ